jgi:MYXO-CTERM domain-containing protein
MMRGILWSDRVKRAGYGTAAALLTMMATQAAVFAKSVPEVVAPEISGASISAGLGLLGAGVLWLRARRGSK